MIFNKHDCTIIRIHNRKKNTIGIDENISNYRLFSITAKPSLVKALTLSKVINSDHNIGLAFSFSHNASGISFLVHRIVNSRMF